MLKKLIRWPLRILVILIVILIVALLAIDSILKTGVEKGATYALGVNTTVDDIDLSLLAGELSMEGLTVDNPEGFTAENLMKSGKFELAVQTGSVFTDTVELDSFVLDGLDMYIEKTATKSNVGVIMDNLKKFESDEPKPDEKPKKEGKKIKVNQIVIRNVKAHFHIMGAPPVTVPVAEIVITDISSDGGGIMMGKLVSKVMIAIFEGVFDAAKGQVSAEALSGMASQVKDLSAAALEQSQKAIEGAGKAVEDAGKSIGDLLNKIPGTKKE